MSTGEKAAHARGPGRRGGPARKAGRGEPRRRDKDGYYWILGRVDDVTTLEDLSVVTRLEAQHDEE